MALTKISCIITDDEPFARKGLQGYVEKIDFLDLKGVCEDALQLGRLLQQQPVDLLFLDIQMPHITGIEFLRTQRDPPKVVFTTAYEQYALQGFELDVLDYLVKPISLERFLRAANKAHDFFSSRREATPGADYMFVKADGKLEKVLFDQVLFLEGVENYVNIYLPDRKIMTHSTLKALYERLPVGRFLQTHKSYIAALDKVERIDGNMLHVGRHEVPVSRNFRDAVMAALVR